MVEMLVGFIGSGKSTYSLKRASEGALIVNDDSIVNAIHAGMNTFYQVEMKHLYKEIEMLILQEGLKETKDIVIDCPNLDKKRRSRYINLAKNFNTYITAIVFPMISPEEHAKRRFNSDSRGYDLEYWTKVAREHFKSYEPVSIDEGFNEIIYLE
jgi:predicted kinase